MSLLIINKQNDTVDIVGVDVPYETSLVAYNQGVLIVKVPGHAYQAGYSWDVRGYARAEYYVYKVHSVIDATPTSFHVYAERCFEIPTKGVDEDIVKQAMRNLIKEAVPDADQE